MPEACYDPVRLGFHGWKKWLVGPIERWCLRRCDRIVATCEAEKGWIEKYLGKRCPAVEVTDVKRFFKLVSGGVESGRVGSGGVGEFGSGGVAKNSQLITHNTQLHLLYLGRRHPLKGVEYLEQAVAELNSNLVNPVNPVQNSSTCSTCPTYPKNSAPSIAQHLCVRFVSNAYGEELEKVWDWCDVLVLPTLSDNFGLVGAEALERGKRVITTDGAPAWEEGLEFRRVLFRSPQPLCRYSGVRFESVETFRKWHCHTQSATDSIYRRPAPIGLVSLHFDFPFVRGDKSNRSHLCRMFGKYAVMADLSSRTRSCGVPSR